MKSVTNSTRQYKIINNFVLVFVLGILLCAPVINVFADIVNGNGYEVTQTIGVSSYELEGNGYSATVKPAVIVGQLEGNGYNSKTASRSTRITPSLSTTPTTPSNSGGGSGGGGGQIAFVAVPLPPIELIAPLTPSEIPAITNASPQSLEERIDAVVRPFVSGTAVLEGLYSDLGETVRRVEETSASEGVVPAVVELATQVYDSKSTFSILTILVIALLFMALGISVFGYQQAHKVVTALVSAGSLFGYYTTSDIYLLPAIVGALILGVFYIRHREHQMTPNAQLIKEEFSTEGSETNTV